MKSKLSTLPLPLCLPCAWGRGGMISAYTANDIRADESLLCLPTQHQGPGIKCLSGDEIVISLGSSTAPPPLHSSPVLFSPLAKATSNPPKSLCFWQGPATFLGKHSSVLAKPRVGTQAALGRALLQLHQDTKCSVSSAAHNPTPKPHSSY